MELQHLRVFVAIAEASRIGVAAKRLGVTQPAVSLTLAQLERELRSPLFHRSPSGLTLTAKGSELLPKARVLLGTMKEIQAAASGASDEDGEIRISGRPGFLEYVFPVLLKNLNKELPRVRVTAIHSGSADEVVEDVRLGRADLGFAASPGIKSIEAEVIFRDPVWLAVSATSPIARKRGIALVDVKSLPFCIPRAEDRLRPSINGLLKKIGVPMSQTIETNDYTLMKNLIAESGFAGFVYAHMLLMEGKGRIRPLSLPEFSVARDLTVLHRRDDISAVAAKARSILIEHAKVVLEKNARVRL